MRINAEIPIATDLLRLILDLPDSYRIVGAETERECQTIRLLVDATRLPDVRDDEPRHLITPVFHRADTGQAVLREIRIITSRERPRAEPVVYRARA